MWDVTLFPFHPFLATLISTHTSHVGCDKSYENFKYATEISTHTSHVGCDGYTTLYKDGISTFLLTHPMWDVTGE